MPRRVGNLTQLFRASFNSFLASLGILNEAGEVIQNEAGEDITSEDMTISGQGMTAARRGGTKQVIMPSTQGFTL